MANDDQYANQGFENLIYNEDANVSYACPRWAPVLGFAGIAASVVLASKSIVSLPSTTTTNADQLHYQIRHHFC